MQRHGGHLLEWGFQDGLRVLCSPGLSVLGQEWEDPAEESQKLTASDSAEETFGPVGGVHQRRGRRAASLTAVRLFNTVRASRVNMDRTTSAQCTAERHHDLA